MRYLQTQYRVSERRSCSALRFDRTSHRYRSTRDDQAFLRHRIRDIAAARVRYGYRRIYIVLRREGIIVNHKRVRRLYREEGLNLRIKRPRRHVSAAHRVERSAATAPNDVWSMDFVSDALFDGRRLRALTLLDVYTREALAIEVDQGIKGEQVVAVLDAVTAGRAHPSASGATTAGVRLQRARPLGLSQRRCPGLQSTRQADRQQLHRIFQRPPQGRMPQRPLVLVPGRCQGQD